jgi:hypothetical protein
MAAAGGTQTITEDTGAEISPTEMWARFSDEYLPESPSITVVGHEVTTSDGGANVTAQLMVLVQPARRAESTQIR